MIDWKAIRIVLLMVLLVGTSVAGVLFYQHQLYFCLFFSVCIVSCIIVHVCNSQNKAIRMMNRMVESIRYGDFSLNFSLEGKSQTEKQVVENINEVMNQFRTKLSNMEERYQYYETLLDTVDSCLLVVDNRGQVLWMNQAGISGLCGHRIHLLEELGSLNKDFPHVIVALQPGEVKVVRVYKDELMQDMAITVTDYSTESASLRLVNLRNIRSPFKCGYLRT